MYISIDNSGLDLNKKYHQPFTPDYAVECL